MKKTANELQCRFGFYTNVGSGGNKTFISGFSTQRTKIYLIKYYYLPNHSLYETDFFSPKFCRKVGIISWFLFQFWIFFSPALLM